MNASHERRAVEHRQPDEPVEHEGVEADAQARRDAARAGCLRASPRRQPCPGRRRSFRSASGFDDDRVGDLVVQTLARLAEDEERVDETVERDDAEIQFTTLRSQISRDSDAGEPSLRTTLMPVAFLPIDWPLRFISTIMKALQSMKPMSARMKATRTAAITASGLSGARPAPAAAAPAPNGMYTISMKMKPSRIAAPNRVPRSATTDASDGSTMSRTVAWGGA